METVTEFVITDDLVGLRLDKALVAGFPDFSRSLLVKKISQGLVLVNAEVETSPKYKTKEGDVLSLTDLSEPLGSGTLEPEPMDLDVVYEDESVLVLNKPVGLVVHPAPGHYTGTLVNGLLYHCGEEISGVNEGNPTRPGIVHRLDRNTSGLMVVAKTLTAYRYLKDQFQERSLSRCYKALVWGVPSPPVGIINRPMDRHPRDRHRMRVLRSGGKEAITYYKVLESFGALASLVECQLKTGRTHQIRAHLANMNHGVIGDDLYGSIYQGPKAKQLADTASTLGQHFLHAYKLSFLHPETEEELSFTQDLPENFLKVLSLLRKDYSGV